MSIHGDYTNGYLCSPVRDVCEKFLVPATNYKIAFLLSRKILLMTWLSRFLRIFLFLFDILPPKVNRIQKPKFNS